MAILYHGGGGVIARNIGDNMKKYCANKEQSRREMLLKHFDSGFACDPNASLCTCCDVGERMCRCTLCS